MQVQQRDDGLRTVLLKHWLDIFLPVDAVPIHFHIIKVSVWLLSHTHTILVIPCPSAALASVRSECPHHCRLHETPGGWSLGPVQTLPLRTRVHFPSQAHPSMELGTTCVFALGLTHDSYVKPSTSVKILET